MRIEMKVIAIIQQPAEIDRILRHPGCQAEQQPKAATRLVKQATASSGFCEAKYHAYTRYKALSGFDPASLN